MTDNVQGADAIVKVGLLYVNELESEKKALEAAQKEAIDYERRTKNKTAQYIKMALKKDLQR